MSFLGEGPYSDQIREKDWSKTPLGSIGSWPQSLQTALSICMNATSPKAIIWGESQVHFYNEAYLKRIPVGYNDHFSESLVAVWPELRRSLNTVYEGKVIRDERTLEANGKQEQFSHSFSPIYAEEGNVGGIFCTLDTAEQKDNYDLGHGLSDDQLIYEVFMQSPAFIAILSGPEHTFELCNPAYMQVVGEHREIIGKSLKEAMPEVTEQGFGTFLDVVYSTGRLHRGFETPVDLRSKEDGQLQKGYYNFIYNPLKDTRGEVYGIFVLGFDVTEQVSSRARAEALTTRLAQQAKTFDTALSSIPEFIYVFDLDDRFTYVNKPLLNLWGKKLKDAVGKNFKDLGYSDDLVELHNRQLQEVKTTLKPITGENSYTNEKGKEGYYEYTFVPVTDKNGKLDAIVGSTHDITNRKAKEIALKEREKHYKSMSDETPVMTWVTNKEGLCTMVNEQWQEYTGQTFDEALGLGWLDALHDDDKEKSNRLFMEAKEKQLPISLEYQVRRRDGEYRWHICLGLPKYDDQGMFAGFIGSVVDIHERKQAEQELEYQKSLLEAQQAVSPLGILIVSPDGEMLNHNDQFVEMWDMPESVMKEKLDDLALKEAMARLDDPEAFLQHVRRVYQTRAKNRDKLYFKNGRVLERYGAPVEDESGKYYGYVWFFMDVTTQEKLASQKEDFIGIASHELKTPVTSIKAYVQILEHKFRALGDQNSEDLLFKMDAQIDRLTKLIVDLLDITKIERGKLRFQYETFDIVPLIKEIVEHIQSTSARHNIILNMETLDCVFGDRDRIGQVITNLLTNAIKYSPKADRVEVFATSNGDELILEVTDYGVGLLEEDKSKVFERFYRADDLDVVTYPGMGLGLYISAGIIERHHGRIWVKSQKDKGSTFSFSLPLSRGKSG